MERKIKKGLLLLSGVFFNAIAIGNTLLLPNTNQSVHQPDTWIHPVFTVTAGTTIAEVGQNQIHKPVDLCFYKYKPHKARVSRALWGIFIGNQMPTFQQPLLNLELGVGYYQPDVFLAKGILTQGADVRSVDNYQYSYYAQSKQLLLEGKLLLKFQSVIRPYALIGLGASFNHTYDYETNVLPYYEYTPYYQNNSQTSFSYAVGTGIDINLHPRWRIGVGYRFTDFGSLNLGPGQIDNIPLSQTLKQSHFYNNQVIAQLTFIPIIN